MATIDFARESGVLDFSGQVAVVTGGARGVGRGITEAFLAAGADVVVCGRTPVADDALPAAVDSTGTLKRAVFVAADLRDADQASSMISAAVERFTGFFAASLRPPSRKRQSLFVSTSRTEPGTWWRGLPFRAGKIGSCKLNQRRCTRAPKCSDCSGLGLFAGRLRRSHSCVIFRQQSM